MGDILCEKEKAKEWREEQWMQRRKACGGRKFREGKERRAE